MREGKQGACPQAILEKVKRRLEEAVGRQEEAVMKLESVEE